MNPGYLFLALNLLGSLSFGHVVKWSQRSKADLMMLGAVNYLVGAGVAAVVALIAGSAGLTPATVAFAIVGGVSFWVSYFFYYQTMGRVGVGITSTLARMTSMPAVVVAILYWGERPTIARIVGIGLTVLALPLLSMQRVPIELKLPGPAWPWLLGFYVTSGAAPLAAKAFQESGLPNAQPTFLTVWFGVAALGSIVVSLRQRLRPTRDDLNFGLILGVANIGGQFAMLSSLSWLAASVVFPFGSAGGVTLAVITSAWLWGERLNRPALAGVVLATASLLLINL